MFEDSGSKIKSVAKVFFVLMLICMFVCGVVSCRSVSAQSGEKISGMGFLSFLLIAGIGSLSAWISCLIIHALGEMVENTSKAVEKQEKIDEKLDMLLKDRAAAASNQQSPLADEYVFCPKCHTANPRQYHYCKACKTPLPEGNTVLCPYCGQVNPKSNKTCAKCGKYLPLILSSQVDAPVEPAPPTPVVRNKVCPKCKKDNPADYLYCQYCGERLS